MTLGDALNLLKRPVPVGRHDPPLTFDDKVEPFWTNLFEVEAWMITIPSIPDLTIKENGSLSSDLLGYPRLDRDVRSGRGIGQAMWSGSSCHR